LTRKSRNGSRPSVVRSRSRNSRKVEILIPRAGVADVGMDHKGHILFKVHLQSGDKGGEGVPVDLEQQRQSVLVYQHGDPVGGRGMIFDTQTIRKQIAESVKRY